MNIANIDHFQALLALKLKALQPQQLTKLETLCLNLLKDITEERSRRKK